jgi:folate-binding protein YgfZ
MNQQWKQFLESQSASISETYAVSFENGDQLSDCALFDLSHLRFIQVSGDDAETFLQGQFTNDIRQVSPEHHQMSAYCTPKGRMLANFRVFSHNGSYILQLPEDTTESLLKRLTMFILRSQVTLEDVSDNIIAIGLVGECSRELLATAFNNLPKAPGDSTEQNGLTILYLPGPTPRFEIVGQTEAIQALWTVLTDKANRTNSNLWSLLDIRSGIPTIYAETVESFVPQMTNMQLIDGVNFDKGCYVGQEIVARMKYLGSLKRRMYLARTDASTNPQPGQELFSTAETKSGLGAGSVVMSTPSPQGGYELLAVIENSIIEAGQLHLESASGPTIEILPLPYEFEKEA